jgi:16S rRNA processing protein RimM
MAPGNPDEAATMRAALGGEGRMVVLGRIAGVHGIHGWVKVFSETEPRENILSYSPWYLGTTAQSLAVLDGRRQGKGLVARLAGCSDRDRAAGLVGMEVAVRRDQLPPATADELYWADLEGLRVETASGDTLGRVDHLFSTGANDVLVVWGARVRLVPFLWGTAVEDVDFERGLIRVRWDPDF